MCIKRISEYVQRNADAGRIIQEILNDGHVLELDMPVKSSIGIVIPAGGVLLCTFALTNVNEDTNHKLVQLSQASILKGKLIGTGKIGPSPSLNTRHVESLVYVPEGAHETSVDVVLSNATFPFNAQGGDKDGDSKIKRMQAVVRVLGAVGAYDGQEGNGAFFSGVEDSDITVFAKSCNRHGLYLGSANQRNNIKAYIEDTKHTGLTMTSGANQSPTSYNNIKATIIDAKPPRAGVKNFSASADMTSNCHYNDVDIVAVSYGETVQALKVSGVDKTDGQHPSNNKFKVRASGEFSGYSVASFHANVNTRLKAYGSAKTTSAGGAWIRIDSAVSNLYSSEYSLIVDEAHIDGRDSSNMGIVTGSPIPVLVKDSDLILRNFYLDKRENGKGSIERA